MLILEEKNIVDKVQAFNKHLDKSINQILKRVPATIAQTNSQTAPINDQGGSTNASNSHRWSPKKSLAPSNLTQDYTILEHCDWIGKMKYWLGFYDDIQPTGKKHYPI